MIVPTEKRVPQLTCLCSLSPGISLVLSGRVTADSGNLQSHQQCIIKEGGCVLHRCTHCQAWSLYWRRDWRRDSHSHGPGALTLYSCIACVLLTPKGSLLW